MKKLIILLTVVATFACCSLGNASLTNGVWASDNDGVIVCNDWSWNSGTSTLWMYGDQFGLPAQPGPGIPGHMLGTVYADSIEDPNLMLSSGVENDTGGAWIGYQVNVVMAVPFTYVVGPSVSTIPADGWFLASGPTPATLQGAGPYAGLYESTFEFSMGTPLGIGEELDFSYKINFASSLDYAFTQEMIPMFAEVPEPSTLFLAGMGGLMLALRLRRNRA